MKEKLLLFPNSISSELNILDNNKTDNIINAKLDTKTIAIKLLLPLFTIFVIVCDSLYFVLSGSNDNLACIPSLTMSFKLLPNNSLFHNLSGSFSNDIICSISSLLWLSLPIIGSKLLSTSTFII